MRSSSDGSSTGPGRSSSGSDSGPGSGRQFFPSTREYARIWGMDRERLGRLPDGALVMHPGPMNRGVEVSADVADADNAVITEQVTNGIAVRMSCLYLLLGGEAA